MLTIEKIRAHPLIGFGESQFVNVIDFPGISLNHAHNFILQFLFQWGLVGTLAILTLATLIIWRAFQSRESQIDVLVPAVTLMSAMTVMASLDGNFFYPQPTTITAIALGLLATIGSMTRRKSR